MIEFYEILHERVENKFLLWYLLKDCLKGVPCSTVVSAPFCIGEPEVESCLCFPEMDQILGSLLPMWDLRESCAASFSVAQP